MLNNIIEEVLEMYKWFSKAKKVVDGAWVEGALLWISEAEAYILDGSFDIEECQRRREYEIETDTICQSTGVSIPPKSRQDGEIECKKLIFVGDVIKEKYYSGYSIYIVKFGDWWNGGQHEDSESGYGFYLEHKQRYNTDTGKTEYINDEEDYNLMGFRDVVLKEDDGENSDIEILGNIHDEDMKKYLI